MLLTTVVRSWVALFFALLIPLSSSPSIVSRVGDQEGATLGRAVFYVAVGVALLWATQPWRQAGRRRPWCFVAAFVLALVAGGRFIASSPEPGVALFFASSWVGLSYVVLAIETADEDVGQQLRQAGMGDGHRESAEQRVRQGDSRTSRQAFLEGHHRRLQSDPREQATHHSAQEQRQDDMHPEGREYQHHQDGGHHGIHSGPLQSTAGA